jgi:hypothetical protein
MEILKCDQNNNQLLHNIHQTLGVINPKLDNIFRYSFSLHGKGASLSTEQRAKARTQVRFNKTDKIPYSKRRRKSYQENGPAGFVSRHNALFIRRKLFEQ